MKNTTINKLLTTVTLGLFTLNFSPVFARVMIIDVLGGGYRLRGPYVLQFADVTASFSAQQTTLDIRDLNAQDEESLSSAEALDYIVIEDLNGGNAFDVSISADTLTTDPDVLPVYTISSDNFYIKNNCANGTNTCAGNSANFVADNATSTLDNISLSSSTNDFVAMPTSSPQTLFTSEGRAPGAWRIFPVFRIEIPANTLPGDYTSTVTLTIT